MGLSLVVRSGVRGGSGVRVGSTTECERVGVRPESPCELRYELRSALRSDFRSDCWRASNSAIDKWPGVQGAGVGGGF